MVWLLNYQTLLKQIFWLHKISNLERFYTCNTRLNTILVKNEKITQRFSKCFNSRKLTDIPRKQFSRHLRHIEVGNGVNHVWCNTTLHSVYKTIPMKRFPGFFSSSDTAFTVKTTFPFLSSKKHLFTSLSWKS